MNKEFIGKCRFYLEDCPDTSVVARLYVVETRSSEYFTAVLDDGDAFPVIYGDGPVPELENVKCFEDLDHRRFFEYPTMTFNNVTFYDRKNNNIGKGDICIIKLPKQDVYIANLIPKNSFKYKQGWEYTVEAGKSMVLPLEIGEPSMMGNRRTLRNSYYQVYCHLDHK